MFKLLAQDITLDLLNVTWPEALKIKPIALINGWECVLPQSVQQLKATTTTQ